MKLAERPVCPAGIWIPEGIEAFELLRPFFADLVAFFDDTKSRFVQ